MIPYIIRVINDILIIIKGWNLREIESLIEQIGVKCANLLHVDIYILPYISYKN